MDDPIQARLIQEALHRLAEDARAGGLADVDHYVELFPAIADRVRAEYTELVAPGDGSDHSSKAGDGEPIDGARVGPYRIQREIGRGGQGVVYLAEDARHGRRVALKVLPASLGLQSARVRREIDAIARLDHPGLCVVYDAGEAEGRAYVAMRHVQGEALDERVREWSAAGASGIASGSRGRTELVQRVELIEKVARALHAAHDVGVTHRDVKPANILVRDDGDPVLLDFGLARLDDSEPNLTRTGELVGTLPYMAPERLAGGAGDTPVADVWSLGVTLYEVLAGRRPFEGATLDVVARQIERDEPADLRTLVPGVPRDLAVIASTALSKEPFKRYPTAEAFADDLERWRDGRPIAARPVGLLGRMVRWTKRNPAAASLVSVLLVALVGSLIGGNRMADLAAREREATKLANERLASESDARRMAQALLARAAFDQAYVELELGHTVRAREHADRATTSWQALRDVPDAADEDLAIALDAVPTLAELRALHASLDGMAAVTNATVVQTSTFGSGALSSDGAMLAQSWINAEMTSYGARVVDVVTGDELGRMTDFDLASIRNTFAVSRDGGWCVAPRRDVSSIGLWSARTARCELWFAVPPGVVDRENTGTCSLAFLDDERAVLGVFAAKDGPDAVVIWRHGIEEAVWRDTSRTVLPYATAQSLHLPIIDPMFVDVAPIDGKAWHAVTPDRRVVFTPGANRVVHRRSVLDGLNTPWEARIDVAVGTYAPALDALVVAADDGWFEVIANGVSVREFNVGVSIHPRLAAHPSAPVVAFVDSESALRVVHLRTGELLARVDDAVDVSSPVDDVGFSVTGDELIVHPSRGSTMRWRLDLSSGWRSREGARVRSGARSWVWNALGTEAADVRDGELVVHTDGLREVLVDEGRWSTVHAANDGWIVIDEDAKRAARFAWPRDPANDVSLDVGGDRDLLKARWVDGALRLITERDDGSIEVGDGASDDLQWTSLAGPGTQWVVVSRTGHHVAVLPLTGARAPMTLSTGAVIVHDLEADTETSIDGLDVGFRDIFSAALSADGRWFAAHVYRPAAAEEAVGTLDRFVALWSVADGGRLVAEWPCAHSLRGPSPVFVDDRWLLVPRINGRVGVHDLAAPDEPLLTFRALPTGVPRLLGVERGVIAWRSGAAELARRFDLERLLADLAARDL